MSRACRRKSAGSGSGGRLQEPVCPTDTTLEDGYAGSDVTKGEHDVEDAVPLVDRGLTPLDGGPEWPSANMIFCTGSSSRA